MNGIINVYKEKDFTSHDVVAKLRGICRQKKIGHTGTLDPQAEGVLPVCLGQATKVCDLLTDKDKIYETVLLLGRTTDTEDVFGETITEEEVSCSEEEVRRVIQTFVGTIRQVPPMYSAKKVGGKKLYELAREGKVIEREAQEITVFSIEVQKMDLPRVTMRIHCSKGTYIRSLCRDIGQALGCGGCMESLLRTKVDRFVLSESHTLKEIEEYRDAGRLEELLLPVDAVFEQLPSAVVKEEAAKRLYNGNTLPLWAFSAAVSADRIRIYDSCGSFIGVYEYSEAGPETGFKPVKLFFER